MRRARWACCRRFGAVLALLVATCWAVAAQAVVVAPTQADILVSDQQAPPAEDDPRWRAVTPTHVERTSVAWYRVRFDTVATGPSTMLYLPFLYGGGRISVNGVPVAEVTESWRRSTCAGSARCCCRCRWARCGRATTCC